MSLVDLPGATRVPVKGQPEDISEKLKKMILKYVENPSAIILAVSAANGDLATSDAIELARLADPSGLRTIGASHLLSSLAACITCGARLRVPRTLVPAQQRALSG